MDRRTYRRNMEDCCGSRKDIPTCRHNEPVCGDVGGRHMHEDMCDKHMHEDMCDKHMHEDMCDKHMHEDMCDKHMHEDMCDKHMHKDMCDRHMHEDMCERERHDGDFDRFPLAMCYVPWQCFRNIYENEFVALANGTLFKELDLKWYGRGCK